MKNPFIAFVLLSMMVGIPSQLVSAQTRWVSASGAADPHLSQGLGEATPADPAKVLGNEACVKCHAAEVRIWQATPHATTFDQLHRRPEAKQIATKLGLQSIKHSGRCVACHYTQQADNDAAGAGETNAIQAHVIAGVSCESCHGAGQDWLALHHDYGGPSITRLTESAEHRAARIATSVRAGMRNPTNAYLVAQSCLRCHTTADEELVNVGGHSAGSLDFEFVSWSQGTLRHNFTGSDGKTNAQRSAEQLRVMFVSGMIAELEAALRATAVATERATFGVTVAKRASRAAKRLQSVCEKVEAPMIEQILQVVAGVQLKLNNEAELRQAADQVAAIGFRIAAENDGTQWSALDAYVPKGRK